MNNENTRSRRGFLVSTAASAACIGCSAFTSKSQPDAVVRATAGAITLSANAARKLSTVGASYRVNVPQGPRLIVVRRESGLVAYSSACTHWGSDVAPNAEGDLECPTHGSRFSTANGSVLEGPAGSPLTRYRVEEHSASGAITIQLS